METVLRWGRSAYETEASLQRERMAAQTLGLAWRHVPDPSPPPEIDRADILVVTSGVRVDSDLLARFSGKLVVTTTSGHDHIDLHAAGAREIAVARLPMARRDPVVEHALAAMTSLLRGLPLLDERARRGVWARSELPSLAPIGLAGETVAILGLGVIGRRMAEVLRGLGARVVGVDPAGVPPGVEETDLEDALARCVAVTAHCSMTSGSRDLLSADALALLSPDAVVVNTARGGILDVVSAVERVRANRLRGLAVDVFPVEPYPALARAVAVPNVLFTPHSAGYTRDLPARLTEELEETLKAWLRGAPLAHRIV